MALKDKMLSLWITDAKRSDFFQIRWAWGDKIKYNLYEKLGVNFYAKCKNCERKSSISISDRSSYKVAPDEDGNIKQMIAVMECRGF